MGNWTILIMKLGCDFTKGDGIFLIYGNTYSLDLYMELLQYSKHKKKAKNKLKFQPPDTSEHAEIQLKGTHKAVQLG